MNTVQFYRLECITDAHVGTGESGFGFIDKLIQKDSATGYPCFNSTGMKGAIKQHIDAYYPVDKTGMLDDGQFKDIFKQTFGSDTKANKGGNSNDTQQGESMFLTAHLLALPVRTNKVSYMLTVSPELIGFFEHLQSVLGIKNENPIFDEISKIVDDDNPNIGKCFVETYEGTEMDIVGTSLTFENNPDLLKKLKELLGFESDRIAVVSDITMAELTSDLYLPVISRNALDDGESKNLWYEQILPRFSRLYFANIWKDDEQKDLFEKTINRPLQVGGNASVSYGLTSISKF